MKQISNKTRKRSIIATLAAAVLTFVTGALFATPLAKAWMTAETASTFTEVNYDFSDTSNDGNFKLTYGSSKPTSSNGKLTVKQWARTYLNVPFNTQENDVYIAFDFYAPSTTHFRTSLATDLTHHASGVNVGDNGDAVCFKMCSEGIQVYKAAMNDLDWIGTHRTNYFGKEHRVEMVITGGYIKYYIDGARKTLSNGKAIPIPYNTVTTTTTDGEGNETTETTYSYDTYLFFESSAAVTIDNLVIKDNFDSLHDDLDRFYDIQESTQSFDGYDVKELPNDKTSGNAGWNNAWTVDGTTELTMLTRSGQYNAGYNWTGAQYYSFTVKNGTNHYVGFTVDVTEGRSGMGRYWTYANGYPYYMEGTDGTMRQGFGKVQSLNRAYVIIPKDFEGRIYLPISGFEILDWTCNNPSDNQYTDDANALSLKNIYFADVFYYPVSTEAKGTVTIGGERIYGKDIPTGKTLDAVAKTQKAITDIGNVTAASEAQIAFARELYNALTDENKTLVTNYATLEAAEETFYSLPNKSYVIGTDGKDFTGTEGVAFGEVFEDSPSTVSAWIRVDRATADGKHVGTVIGNAARKGSTVYDDTNQFSFEITTNGNPKFEWRKTTALKAVFIVDNADVRTGKWMHVAFTRDAANGLLTCYINGTAVATMTTTADRLANITLVQPAMVGSDYTNEKVLGSGFTPDFNGSIADVRVYSSVLTAAEIAEDYEGTIADGLLGGIDFASGEADYYFDYANADAEDAFGWKTVENSYFAAQDGEFTFAVIPDTQMLYSRAPKDSAGNSIHGENYKAEDNLFYNNLEWLVENRDLLNLQYVMHVGDLTDNLNYFTASSVDNTKKKYEVEGKYEAKYAFEALSYLTENEVKWALARGNHDGGYNSGALAIWDEYWTASEAYTKAMTADQAEGAPAKYCTATVNGDGYQGTYSYYETLTINEVNYLVLVLDLEAGDTILTWANEVLDYYSDHKAIILTHAYINALGTGFITTLMGSSTYQNYASALWNDCASLHENVIMMVCGHSSGPNIGKKVLTGVNGNKVWNFMIDLSSYEFNGSIQPGLFSLLKFAADGSSVTVNLYSARLGQIFRNVNTFTVNLGEMEEVEETTDQPMTAIPDTNLVLLPNVQSFTAYGSSAGATYQLNSSQKMQIAANGIQFLGGYCAYIVTMDIDKAGTFRFDSGCYVKGTTVYTAVYHTKSADNLTRKVIPSGTTEFVKTTTQHSFAADVGDITVAAGDKISIIFFGSQVWAKCYIGAGIYDAQDTEIRDYAVLPIGGATGGSGGNATIKNLQQVGYGNVDEDGNPINYNGYTFGIITFNADAIGGSGAIGTFTYGMTVTDGETEVFTTKLAYHSGSKLPELIKQGYIFKGYQIGSTLYPAGTLYKIGGANVTAAAIFEEIKEVPVYDTDGFLATTLPKGFNGALPALNRTGRIFFGYLIDGQLCPAGTVFDSTSGKTITAVFAKFGMINGASARTDTPTGIRFQTYFDKSVYDILTAAGYTVSFGTLIIPADFITENGAVNYNLLTLDTQLTTLNIASTKQFTVGDYMYYNAAVVNVKEGNYNRQFLARGYMQITKDGETTTYYAGVNDNARTIVEIAQKALADVFAVKTSLYQYAVEGGYSRYSTEQIETLETIAAKAE